MMNDTLLSICIPTYNFGKFIGETLDSIISQVENANVEIVIVDGASTDNTQEIVENYAKKWSYIRYHRQSRKGGIDHDMELSVSLAQGRYCWLFSSDDVMRPGALKSILSEIKSAYDLYLCGFCIYSFDLTSEAGKFPILNLHENKEFNLLEKRERKLYFEMAITTTAFFSFMSSLIINKKRWDEIVDVKDFHGTCWAHVARIFTLLSNGLKVKYLTDSFLNKRSDNDSFLDKGIINRLALAIDGYHQIANHFFGENSMESFHIRRTLRNEMGISLFHSLKNNKSSEQERKNLDRIVQKIYQDPIFSNYLRKFMYKYVPPLLFRAIKAALGK
jgi:abequosyltransferase